MKIPQSFCFGSGFGLCVSLPVNHSWTCPRLCGEEEKGGTVPHGAALHLSCDDSGEEREQTQWVHVQYSTYSSASCGFTDRFNCDISLCCRGDRLLLTFYFPEREEVSQPPAPTHWGEVIPGHMHRIIVCLLSVQLNDTSLYLDWISFYVGKCHNCEIKFSVCGLQSSTVLSVCLESETLAPIASQGHLTVKTDSRLI